jgi:hypothetical protein
MDTRLTGEGMSTSHDSVRPLVPSDATPIDLAVDYRKLAANYATVASECLQERRKTNEALAEVNDHLRSLRNASPPPRGWWLVVSAVTLLSAMQVVELGHRLGFWSLH